MSTGYCDHHEYSSTIFRGDESDYSEDYAPDGENSADGSGSSASKTEAAVTTMTKYVADPTKELFGTATDQTEELSDDNKSIVWFLVKQVRPGMDLSRVVLPTFILEPRSFLEKISDYYYHADIIAE